MLTGKVTTIVILSFLGAGMVNFTVHKMFIQPSFLSIEKEIAAKNAKRALMAIGRELEQIRPSVSDWAYWTETYNYANRQNPDYVKDNLEEGTTLQGLNMNFMGIFDTAGNSVWSRGIDLTTGNRIDMGALTGPKLAPDSPLLQHQGLDNDLVGVINTVYAPLLIVAKPILTNDRKGPGAGTLILGRLLDTNAIDRIADVTKLPVIAIPPNPELVYSIVPEEPHVHEGLRHSELNLIATPNDWQVQTTIADLFGNPVLTLQVTTSREISIQGAKVVNHSLLILSATGLVIMLVLWLVVRCTILGPIVKLTEHALLIGENDNLLPPPMIKRNDEVGLLAKTFDQMVDRLAESRKRLMEQSYNSGIAEMAGGVLHNIGNAVTPLKIRLSTLHQKLKEAPLADLEQATTELGDPSTPFTRHADLMQFIDLAENELANQLKGTRDEVQAAIQQVENVQDILLGHQRFSTFTQIIEPVDMAVVIKGATSGLTPQFKNIMHVEVKPSVAKVGAVAGSCVVLQQVVANLLINAAESILSVGTGRCAGQVTVSAKRELFRGQAMAHLCFEDNGAGIHPEHIERLFERGFSTKGRKGSGFGLHWCANIVQALGGKIYAESSNLGHSAAYLHLLLPLIEKLPQQSYTMDKDDDRLQ